jgi:hypothetical protein
MSSGSLPAPVSAAPVTIDFSTGGIGVVGTTYVDAITGLQVEAYYLTSGVWTATNLFRRNEPTDDVGFGVCSPGETCGSGLGLGDYNELSNAVNPELIVLKLPSGYSWVEVGISSIDTNGAGTPDGYERGQMWASDSFPGTTPGSLFGGTALWQFTGIASANLSFSGFTPFNNESAYLIFEAFDWLGSSTNNDYLVHYVALDESSNEVDQVPEPATLGLLGMGITLWALARRRRGAAPLPSEPR